MFERYTEAARRVLFFARYEASLLAGNSLETEHVLLGLLREGRGVVGSAFERSQVTYEGLHQEIARRSAPGEPVSTAVDIPLSASCQRVLQHAAEEADRLQAAEVGTEHLLLGVLREPDALPASVRASNLRLDDVREEVRLLARAGGVARRVEAFENLAVFLAAVEDGDGGVAVETFAAVGSVQDETALPGLLDALGPPRPRG